MRTQLALMMLVVAVGCSKRKPDECDQLYAKMIPVMPAFAKQGDKDKGLEDCRKNIEKVRADPTTKCVLDATGDDEVKKCLGRAYGQYQKQSREIEATSNLSLIGKDAERVFAETGAFPTGTAAILPANDSHGAGANCCGGMGGTKQSPGTTVNNHCTADREAFANDPAWKALGFTIDEPSEYQYKYVGGDKTFTATAIGDLDCDGISAIWTLEGKVDDSGKVVTNLVKPLRGLM
jgi:hypothetical protein